MVLYTYKNQCLERGLSKRTTRQHLGILKHYFASLNREDNPALLVKHAKKETTLPNHLLLENELKELYRNAQTKTLIGKRNKVILGMTIFQGLKNEELSLIELDHIHLDNATIYVSSTSITNVRTLSLSPLQIHHLMEYLYEIRPRLLNEANKTTNRLFFSMGKGNSLTNAINLMTKELKKEYPIFKTITQLRESRMAIWVKEYGIRKAQYLSGIKYTSSMLRYKTTDIEQLKKKLAIAHPMERLKL